MGVASKFQKIHSDLIIEATNRQFVSEEDKVKIQGALQTNNNLADIPDKQQAVANLGIDALLSSLAQTSITNDRVLITDGKFTLSNPPLNNKIIFDMCYIVSPNNNIIIAEEYDGLYIDGINCEFKEKDAEYEGMMCLVSYIHYQYNHYD